MSDINNIEKIKQKYITKNNYSTSFHPKLKRNLQAEINKINSIADLVNNKNIPFSELSRLEFSLELLLKLVRNLKCTEHHQY